MPAKGAVLLNEESVFDTRLARLTSLSWVGNSLKCAHLSLPSLYNGTSDSDVGRAETQTDEVIDCVRGRHFQRGNGFWVSSGRTTISYMIQVPLVDPRIQNVAEMTRWEPYGSDIFMPDLLEWHLYRGVFPHHAHLRRSGSWGSPDLI